MAITKRFRVSFDVTVTASTEQVVAFTEELVTISNKVIKGEDTTHLEKLLVFKAVEDGVEEAISFGIKQGIRKRIKEEIVEEGAKVSPAFVREIK